MRRCTFDGRSGQVHTRCCGDRRLGLLGRRDFGTLVSGGGIGAGRFLGRGGLLWLLDGWGASGDEALEGGWGGLVDG